MLELLLRYNIAILCLTVLHCRLLTEKRIRLTYIPNNNVNVHIKSICDTLNIVN